MKNKIIAILSALIVLLGGGVAYNQLGSGFNENTVTLMGSSSDLVSVPNSGVEGNSTTTDSGTSVLDGGYTIQQLVNTGGIREVKLNISAVGGTATSTGYLQVMGSNDGTNYYKLSTSTDPYTKLATTTIAIKQKAFVFVPGTATTTISIPIQIDGYRFTRFILWGDNLSTDSNDGIQAWITATLIEDYK
uniref:Uncharacterized protein n=1 Tax=viral metagenome TaxID=1070528 RepID=A0A6H1ZKX8_9ZZZZ